MLSGAWAEEDQLRAAQQVLKDQGFYYRLQSTGRLDMSTLANLDLLPRRVPPQVREVPGRPVYRGIWIQ